MIVPAGMGVVSIPIASITGEWPAAVSFAGVALVSGCLAACALLIEPRSELRVRTALVAAAVAWLLVALLGCIPFLATAFLYGAEGGDQLGVFRSFWNAFFESMSGITTTGLTVVDHPSELPVSLIWWRSLSQWVGGAGIILFILAVVDPQREGQMLFRAEGHPGNLREDVRLTARGLWKVYVLLTGIGLLLLWAFGMSPWLALNFAMTSIATGGFSPTDDSLASFSGPLQLSVSLLVIFGATNFSTHACALRRDWRNVVADIQLRVFLGAALIGFGLIFSLRYFHTGRPEFVSAWFQVVSTLGTAGFYTEDISSWSEAALFALVIAMIVGGASGSASGGIKIRRTWTLVITMAGYLKRIVTEPHLFVYRPGALPHEVHPELTGHIAVAVIMLILWLTTIILGSLCLGFLVAPTASLGAIVFDVTSAVSTVGLSAGVVSASMSAAAKFLFIGLMWMGRLEILPVIILFAVMTRIGAGSKS